MIGWQEPATFLHGLTAHQRRSLKALSVETVGELLSIFPRRYDDYSACVPVAQIPDGIPVTVRVRVQSIGKMKTFRQRFSIIRALVTDDSGTIAVTWFNQPWLLEHLTVGREIFISGVVTQRPRFGRGFTSPLWEPATEETIAAGHLAPVYPLSGPVSQKAMRTVMKMALEEAALPEEWLPVPLVERYQLVDLKTAFRDIHAPATSQIAERARQRFAFQELFIYQLALRLARVESDTAGAPAIPFDEGFAKKFVATLPFTLTEDQKRAVWAACQEMQGTRPMRRLVQGDVGSGKTVVAAMLMAQAFRAGLSAVLMAPTDVLAKQHAETFRRLYAPHHIPVLLYTSSTRRLWEGGEEQVCSPQEARERCAKGRIIAIGTHAVLEKGQRPYDIGLAVVDEQHRFGVTQREALTVSLRDDGHTPHLLSMTATPIPRSLALTLLGDLDCSVIRTKPVGRLPIITRLVHGSEMREDAYHAIRQQIVEGRQIFVVCPLIDPSDTSGAKSVEDEAKRLALGPLKGMRISVVHGRLSSREKDEVMSAFSRHESDVLVATTVVEVGVDVPEATVMFIEGAERFGLAQLHQLRGRVGRSKFQSWCFLAVTEGAEHALERLQIMEQTQDGFAIAEADLRDRGEGNILGVQQSGAMIFKTARVTDLEIMANAREAAAEIVRMDPTLEAVPMVKAEIEKMRETSHRE